uniref:Uncharacterized protein n=1 Tax=Ditylenchus dipsaci TaxID=166011 RepID=A0A915DGA8_9BILA
MDAMAVQGDTIKAVKKLVSQTRQVHREISDILQQRKFGVCIEIKERCQVNLDVGRITDDEITKLINAVNIEIFVLVGQLVTVVKLYSNSMTGRPNTIKYETKVMLCKKPVQVTARECWKMWNEDKCEHGKMVKDDDMWTTENKMDIDYPWPVFGSLWRNNKTIHNCFRFDIRVFARFGGEKVTIPASDGNGCG